MSYLDYINRAYNDKSLQEAQRATAAAEADLTKLQGQLPNYLENKQRELVAADPALQQLNAERAKFASQLFSKPFEARSQYADIFDPVKREALVSQAIGNVMGQLTGTEGMIGLRKQKASDLAQQAYNLLQSQIDIGKTKYEKASGKQDALLKLITTSAEKQYDAQAKKDQYLFEQKNKRFAPTSGAGDYSPEDVKAWVQFAADQGENFSITSVPAELRGAVVAGINAVNAGLDSGATTDTPKFDPTTGVATSPDEWKVQWQKDLKDVTRQLAGMKMVDKNYIPLLNRKKDLEKKLYSGQSIR